MQCPKWREIEKGQWLYSNGCRSFPEFSMDTHDEDLHDLSYSEMTEEEEQRLTDLQFVLMSLFASQTSTLCFHTVSIYWCKIVYRAFCLFEVLSDAKGVDIYWVSVKD